MNISVAMFKTKNKGILTRFQNGCWSGNKLDSPPPPPAKSISLVSNVTLICEREKLLDSNFKQN